MISIEHGQYVKLSYLLILIHNERKRLALQKDENQTGTFEQVLTHAENMQSKGVRKTEQLCIKFSGQIAPNIKRLFWIPEQQLT